MIYVTKINVVDNSVDVEFSAAGMLISTRVPNAAMLSAQEIVEKGYAILKPSIDRHCEQTGRPLETVFAPVKDHITSIRVLGAVDVNFTEGEQPREVFFRCVGYTQFGKTIDLSSKAVFKPSRVMVLNPTQDALVAISAEYENMFDGRTFNVHYTSLAEVEARNSQAAAEEQVRLDAEAEAYANRPLTVDERLDYFKKVIDELLDVTPPAEVTRANVDSVQEECITKAKEIKDKVKESKDKVKTVTLTV